jgi:hypothetical protein
MDKMAYRCALLGASLSWPAAQQLLLGWWLEACEVYATALIEVLAALGPYTQCLASLAADGAEPTYVCRQPSTQSLVWGGSAQVPGWHFLLACWFARRMPLDLQPPLQPSATTLAAAAAPGGSCTAVVTAARCDVCLQQSYNAVAFVSCLRTPAQPLPCRTGLSDLTAVVPAIADCGGNTDTITLASSRLEFAETCFPCVQEVLDKTGLTPSDIDFVVSSFADVHIAGMRAFICACAAEGLRLCWNSSTPNSYSIRENTCCGRSPICACHARLL